MLYGEEAEGRLGPGVLGFLGFYGFLSFLENNNTDSWNMLYIKIHEPMIFETQKIKI
jgi:hypothetical protein